MLFNTAMVKAILENRKTQTRRPIELGPYSPDYYAIYKLRHKVGDILWVRETWAYDDYSCIIYRADGERPGVKWRPSIHMPREACRLVLEVDEVGICRLQDISEDDAKAEGVESIAAFHFLWNSIYNELQCRWEWNPWVSYTKFHITELNK